MHKLKILFVIVSQGPNFQWHMDQYDKFANFGIYIHGCIDGYMVLSSWKLWFIARLKVFTQDYVAACWTIQDECECCAWILPKSCRLPKWYHDLYISLIIIKFTGCPQVVRMDRGSENARVAALRMSHTDERAGARSIIYGSSPTNSVRPPMLTSLTCSACVQRIESWWSRLRRQKTHWWIENLKVIVNNQTFKHDWTLQFLERSGWFDSTNQLNRQCEHL